MERRAKYRLGLSRLYVPYYDALCAELGPHWQPYMGTRTFEEQDRLYATGREGRPGAKLTNARGGESAHNYGCASDWTVWEDGKPLWPAASDKIWLEYTQALEKIGLVAGANFRFKDMVHNELRVSCSWKHVLIAYRQGGMTAAQHHIERNIIK